MTNTQIEKVRKLMLNETKGVKPGSKEAKQAALKRLVAAGIATTKGALTKAYR